MTAPPQPLPYLTPDWPAPPQVRACVTLRQGGVSGGEYASLNLGTHVGDDPACVAANRQRLREALALPSGPRWLEQVHGTRILDLGGSNDADDAADGAVTGEAGVVAVVMTADCLPVLFCDRQGRRVGVAHAGWRGLAAGVLQAAIAALAVPPADLHAWLGPAISAPAYEVGDEVRAAFSDQDRDAAFSANPRGRWQADLYSLARRALMRSGVVSIHGGGFCTFGDQRFYSHRRAAPCGRFATLIWMAGDGGRLIST